MTRLCAQISDPQPPALDFNVIVTRVEPAGSAPDYQLQNSALRTVRVGHQVDLSLYFSVTDAPAEMHCHRRIHRRNTAQASSSTAAARQ